MSTFWSLHLKGLCLNVLAQSVNMFMVVILTTPKFDHTQICCVCTVCYVSIMCSAKLYTRAAVPSLYGVIHLVYTR